MASTDGITTGTATAVPEYASGVNVPVPTKPTVNIIPHRSVCDANTRCDRCRRLGCSGCVHTDGTHIGLCAVCARNFREEETDLHPIPTAEELKDIPAIVMPPALFKKGQKVMIFDTGKIFKEWEIMAKALGADNWQIGNTANKNTICKILNVGLHLDQPRKGHVYLLQMESYPNRQILCLETGLDGSEEAVNWKRLCIGQKVIIKNSFKTPKFYDPSYSGTMTGMKGQSFLISQQLTDKRCYKLSGDTEENVWSHEWLEPVKPILRKDRAVKGDTFFIKSPIKRLYYIPWIRMECRRNSGGRQGCKTPNLPYTFTSEIKGKKEIKIEENLFRELRAVHQEYSNFWGWRTDNSSQSQPLPLAFILGEKNGVVVTALPVFNDFKSPRGCGQMVTIEERDFTNLTAEIIKMKCSPCGIARLGGFNVYDDSARGDSLSQLRRYKDFFILSIGRNGMLIQSQNKDGYTEPHSFEVVKLKDMKKGGITKDALIPTDTPAKAEEVPVIHEDAVEF